MCDIRSGSHLSMCCSDRYCSIHMFLVTSKTVKINQREIFFIEVGSGTSWDDLLNLYIVSSQNNTPS